jgi:hypothetical protein
MRNEKVGRNDASDFIQAPTQELTCGVGINRL